MRLFIVSLLGLVVGIALADCPYASSLGKKTASSYAQRDTSDTFPSAFSARSLTAEGKLGVMFMNRIGPSSSVLYVADADGTNERQLLTGNNSVFEYHASFSPDGEWITFTSERAGDGQSDIYRVRTNGSQLEELVATPSFEDAGMFSDSQNIVSCFGCLAGLDLSNIS
jgi:Tol biopolymer transport system component